MWQQAVAISMITCHVRYLGWPARWCYAVSIRNLLLCLRPCLLLLQSSHKLQVVVVCEEPLSRITYLARAVQVEPLSAEVAGQMVQQAQANVKQVSSV